MSWYEDFLKRFFHDPIDKPFDIQKHEQRAKDYADIFNVSGIEEGKYSDQIASCMERSLLPKGIKQDFNEVRHPLSEGKIDFTLNRQKCIDEVSKVLEEISKSYKYLSGERKALQIWRNLLDEILDKIEDHDLRKFTPILPADTRVPDHSIWEHLKVATAVNAFENLQNNSLFLFTIGTVQSFISQARKTQDFYMGSFILSYLTFIAIEEVVERYGPTAIIYPDLYKQPLMDWYLTNKKSLDIKNFEPEGVTLPTIPNRFVAIIGSTDGDEIKRLAESMDEKIREKIKNASDEILKMLGISLTDGQKEVLQRQLSDFPQIYWVAIPWRKGDNDLKIDDLKDFFTDEKINKWDEFHDFAVKEGEYPPNIGFLYQLIYTALEKSMGVRKNLREFKQREEAGRKCSVCGERNVLFYRDDGKPLFISDNLKYFYGEPEERKNSFFELDGEKITYKILGEKEGLCALCFLKRTFEIYLEKEVDEIFMAFSFPSTAEVACADFKEGAIKEAKEEFNEYVKVFLDFTKKEYLKVEPLPKLRFELKKENNLEGSWFFEENLTEEKIREELGIEVSIEGLSKLKKLLKKLYEKIKKPLPYYAILYLDGDNMGKWLSGELLPEIEFAYNSEVWGEKLPYNFKRELQDRLIELDLEKKRAKKILTPAIHSAISTALRNYAIEFVRKIVEEEHLGKLIYAGGDDVLAFVNLRDLFEVMEKLRWAFSGQIRFEDGRVVVDINNGTGFVLKDDVYYLTMGKSATCSMGVVIAHYKEPLKIVIDKVFEMKKRAKNSGRNRFAICLLKHSGGERVGVAEWEIEDNLTTEILRNLKDWMNRGRDEKRYISDGFIQKMKREFQRLKISVYGGIINTELKRLVARAYNGPKNDMANFVDQFVKNAQKLYWGTGEDIDNFTDLLEIASFINKGE